MYQQHKRFRAHLYNEPEAVVTCYLAIPPGICDDGVGPDQWDPKLVVLAVDLLEIYHFILGQKTWIITCICLAIV